MARFSEGFLRTSTAHQPSESGSNGEHRTGVRHIHRVPEGAFLDTATQFFVRIRHKPQYKLPEDEWLLQWTGMITPFLDRRLCHRSGHDLSDLTFWKVDRPLQWPDPETCPRFGYALYRSTVVKVKHKGRSFWKVWVTLQMS